MFLKFRLVAAGDDRDNDPAFFHHAIRTRERIAANRVQHKIDIVRDLFEFLFRVINSDIGPELFQQILLSGRSRGDDAGSPAFRDLKGETADAARAAMNQYRLASLNLSDVD